MTCRSPGRAARPQQAPGMIRETERTRAVYLRFLPDPMNRNTRGKVWFLEASMSPQGVRAAGIAVSGGTVPTFAAIPPIMFPNFSGISRIAVITISA